MVKLVGTGGNQVPTNNMLGNMAFQNKEGASIDLLGLAAGTAATPSLIPTGDPNTGMWFPAADTIAWSTGGSERTRIDASGRFLFGADTAVLSGFQGAGFTPSFQLHGATGSAASSGLFNWSSGASSPYTITFNKSISGIVGTRGALTGGASLGNLVFNGDNGTTFSTAAAISASIDATPSPTSMPGRIEFYTTPTGSLTALERMRIRANGNVGIGTSAPDALLSVNGIASFGAGAAATPSIAAFGDLNTGMWFPAVDTIAWSTGGSERVRIDNSGRLLLGTDTAIATGIQGVASTPSFQFHGILVSPSSAGFYNWNTSASTSSVFTFNKSVGGVVGTRGGLTASGTSYGSIAFNGDNGTTFSTAAIIAALADAAPSATSMPGRIVFFTTPSGSLTATERMRIRANGDVGIGTSAPDALLSVNGIASFGAGAVATPSIAAFGDLNTGMWFPAADTIAWSTNGGERLRITSAGNVGIGTSSPSYVLDVVAPSDATSLNLRGRASDDIGVLRFATNANTERFAIDVRSDSTLFCTGTARTIRIRIADSGSVVINNAAIATTATDGFLYVPSCAGTPTGTPTTFTGRVPIVVDATNNKLYFYSGGQWRDAGP